MNLGEHSGSSNPVLETLKGNHESICSKVESALLIFGKDVNKQCIITGQKTENKGNGEEALKSLTSKERSGANHACIVTMVGTEKRLNSHINRQSLSDCAK